MPAQVIRATDDGWLIRMHVRPEFTVGLGDALFDILHEDDGGVAMTIRSPDSGVIKSYEGVDIFYDNDNDPRTIRLRGGDPLFVIAPHIDGKEAGTFKGLQPRPTTVIAKRRARGLNLS